jgi:hypothetical protein
MTKKNIDECSADDLQKKILSCCSDEHASKTKYMKKLLSYLNSTFFNVKSVNLVENYKDGNNLVSMYFRIDTASTSLVTLYVSCPRRIIIKLEVNVVG